MRQNESFAAFLIEEEKNESLFSFFSSSIKNAHPISKRSDGHYNVVPISPPQGQGCAARRIPLTTSGMRRQANPINTLFPSVILSQLKAK
jgi:hypothetical protein